MIEGISHITFIVKDLDKMAHLLLSIFDAQEVYSSGEKKFSISREKFFLINGLWIAIMEGASLAEKSYNHVAFKIPPADLESYMLRIKNLGLELRQARSRAKGEGESLYFYDYDNHLFELHTGTLAQRIKTYSEAPDDNAN